MSKNNTLALTLGLYQMLVGRRNMVLQQALADTFASAAGFKQHVIEQHHASTAILLHNCYDVLEKMVTQYSTSWMKAVAQTIRLGGDVDTIGAIFGGLMKSRLGAQALPAHILADIQHHEQIRYMAAQFAALLAERSNPHPLIPEIHL